jgi:hypothetical protein
VTDWLSDFRTPVRDRMAFGNDFHRLTPAWLRGRGLLAACAHRA